MAFRPPLLMLKAGAYRKDRLALTAKGRSLRWHYPVSGSMGMISAAVNRAAPQGMPKHKAGRTRPQVMISIKFAAIELSHCGFACCNARGGNWASTESLQRSQAKRTAAKRTAGKEKGRTEILPLMSWL